MSATATLPQQNKTKTLTPEAVRMEELRLLIQDNKAKGANVSADLYAEYARLQKAVVTQTIAAEKSRLQGATAKAPEPKPEPKPIEAKAPEPTKPVESKAVEPTKAPETKPEPKPAEAKAPEKKPEPAKPVESKTPAPTKAPEPKPAATPAAAAKDKPVTTPADKKPAEVVPQTSAAKKGTPWLLWILIAAALAVATLILTK